MKVSPQVGAGPSSLPPLRRVLCALDLARPHASSLAFSRQIAQRFGAAHEALYVGAPEGRGDELEMEGLLRRAGGPPAAAVHVAYGRPAPAIIERATPADLIVLGCRQRSELGWQFRDDVARDVAALAPCATLTVHERDSAEIVERILVPVDFGASTARALQWAAAFALHFQAKVQLLHVVSREQHTVRSLDRNSNVQRCSVVPGALAHQLIELEHWLHALGVRAGSEVVVDASTAHGIESYNQRGEVDLVVMGLGHVTHGSRVTRSVVATLRNRLSVPLLSIASVELEDGTAPGRALAKRSSNAAGGISLRA